MKLHLIMGPNSVGKTDRSIHVAKQKHIPVLVLNRFEMYSELATGCGQPSFEETQGTLRIYLAERKLADGEFTALEAERCFYEWIKRLTPSHREIILEGGSTSLLLRLWEQGAFREHELTLELFTIADKEAYRERMQMRVAQMLSSVPGQLSMVEELAQAALSCPQQLDYVLSIAGYDVIEAWRREQGLDYDAAIVAAQQEHHKRQLIQGICESYYNYALQQDTTFRDLAEKMKNSEAQKALMNAARNVAHLAAGQRTSMALYVIAKKDIADLLYEKAQSADELAAVSGLDADALRRVMNCLLQQGFFSLNDSGKYVLSPKAQPLLSHTDFSMRDYVIMHGEEFHYLPWGKFLDCVIHGEAMFEQVMGEPAYEYLFHHPEAQKIFDGAMSGYTTFEAQAIAEAYPFEECTSLMDLGGGEGKLLKVILERYPHLHATLCDHSSVIDKAKKYLDSYVQQGKVDFVASDIDTSIPITQHCIMMKNILHHYNPQKAEVFLKNCRAALPRGGRLLIMEKLLEPGSPSAYLLDLELMLTVGGRCRSQEEMAELLKQSGFRLQQVYSSTSGIHISSAEAV